MPQGLRFHEAAAEVYLAGHRRRRSLHCLTTMTSRRCHTCLRGSSEDLQSPAAAALSHISPYVFSVAVHHLCTQRWSAASQLVISTENYN